jgi:hypothetical protein
MSFDNFPTQLPSIEKALTTLLFDQLGMPPDMRSIGQRTYEAFLSNQSNLALIKSRDWCHVPYAIWLDKGGLYNMPKAIDHYLNQELPNAISTSRRPIKWCRPLAFSYIERYDPTNSLFRKISAHTKYIFELEKLDNSSKIVDFFRELNIFDVDEGPKRVALSISTSKQTLKEWIKKHDLWESFDTSPFTEAAFKAFLETNEDFRRSHEFLNTIFEWAINDILALRHPDLRASLAEALLLPWCSASPSEWTKNRIITFLLKYYDDPRISKKLWHKVNKSAVSVLVNWINERTLDLFFKILKDTEDVIWVYRRNFWMAYFKAHNIDEVWFALGSRAAIALKKYDSAGQLNYANLYGTDNTQSVLFIRIGQFIFCEWSHDGKLRAQRIDASNAPKLYELNYESDELRFHSLDFNNNQNQDPALIHFSSQNGGWQERARVFIQRNTGIKMNQADVM